MMQAKINLDDHRNFWRLLMTEENYVNITDGEVIRRLSNPVYQPRLLDWRHELDEHDFMRLIYNDQFLDGVMDFEYHHRMLYWRGEMSAINFMRLLEIDSFVDHMHDEDFHQLLSFSTREIT